MIELDDRCRLCEEPEDLPPLPQAVGRLYLDFETSSRDPATKSLNPWDVEHCRVIGAAITWDDCPVAWFVPRSLLEHDGKRWLRDLLRRARAWVNHNVKYDAHVLANDLGLRFDGELHDTVSKTKVYDCDRTYKGGYDLETLSRQLVGWDIAEYGARLRPYLMTTGPMRSRNKDYGRVPIDLLAHYACVDVLSCRELDAWLDREMWAESDWVWRNEVQLCGALVDVERRGMWAETIEVKKALFLSMHRMLQIEAQLRETLGYDVKPGSYDDCHDLLINVMGFPPIYNDASIKRAEKSGSVPSPSFDKNTLAAYARAPGPHQQTVKLIREYRLVAHTKSLFWEPWLELADRDGTLHPSYNANVRSGRLSCRQPNAQQLHKAAKRLIRARPGRKLLCWDYSQLEYRWMAHYLRNERAIKSYNDDPRTDWHQWVADVLCGGIERRAAKTLNFTIGFGGGRRRVVHMLSIDPTIVARTGGDEAAARRLGLDVYYRYHRNLPELKTESARAERAALERGYVRTLYGRRLPLPPAHARKGFNRVVQSTAADNAKEAAVAASPRYNATLRENDCHLIAQVHDEFLYDVPDDEDAIRVCSREITRCLQAPSSRCRVPILAGRGEPADCWADAKPD